MNKVTQASNNFQTSFSSEAAKDLSAVFQFNVTDAEPFALTIQSGVCTASDGMNDSADITLVVDADTLLSLSDGSLDGMQAFMAGKLRVEGDMMLAMKLHELFPV